MWYKEVARVARWCSNPLHNRASTNSGIATMKSSQIVSLLTLLSAAAASPVPQDIVTTSQAGSITTTQAVSTITVIPVPASASPYPAAPTTNEFQYENYDENNQDDKDRRDKVHNAFAGDWAQVFQKGIEVCQVRSQMWYFIMHSTARLRSDTPARSSEYHSFDDADDS